MSRNATSRPALWVCLGLSALLLAVYHSVANHEFVFFDDPAYLQFNPCVHRGLNWPDLRWAFTSGYASNWHPLTWLSHTLDWSIFGDWAGGHHLTSLALHALNSWLVFLVVRRLLAVAQVPVEPSSAKIPSASGKLLARPSQRSASPTPRASPANGASAVEDRTGGFSAESSYWIALFTAAAFAVHPLHVESVAWASERKDVLSGLFWWLTIGAYLDWTQRPSWPRYGLVVVALALGLMAKPMLVTLPFVLLLLDIWPLRRLGPIDGRWRFDRREVLRHVTEKAPLFLLSMASSVITYFVQRAGGAVIEGDRLGWLARLAVSLAAYWQYLAKTIWPVGLSAFYSLPTRRLLTAPQWHAPAWLGAAAIVALTCFCLWQRRRPYFIVGWCWFLGALVPVIGLVKVGDQAAADRYMYLPQTGLILAMACAAAEIVEARARWARPLLLGGAALIGVWSALSYRQVATWRNTESLARQELAVDPNNGGAHYLLGAAYAGRQEPQAAIAAFQRALELNPDLFSARQDLATVLLGQGRVDEATEQYQFLLKTRPSFDLPHAGMAEVLLFKGQYADALAEVDRALELDSHNHNSHASRAEILLALNRPADSLADFQAAHELGARNGEFRVKWVEALLRCGRAQAGEQGATRWLDDRKFLLTDANKVRALYLLGEARKMQGNLPGCLAAWRLALQNEPFSASVANDLAWVLATSPEASVRSPQEALLLARRANENSTTPLPAWLDTWAAAEANAGNFPTAVDIAERAVALAQQAQDPSTAAVIAARARLYRQGQPYREQYNQ